MDVSSAYLQSELTEEVYMVQPKIFTNKKLPNHVLKINKALYVLKQSGRQRKIKLDTILKEIGFYQCDSEPCVYTLNKDNNIYLIVVYVDDFLIASSHNKDLSEIKSKIAKRIEVDDKGPV